MLRLLYLMPCFGLATTGLLAQSLTVIEQDYAAAMAAAGREDKLLFVDFYTTWCAPCKELDRDVFQNDSVADILARDFVLLRYDAERDTAWHLAKKHHVNSYPTGLLLTPAGEVVLRKYGFPGETAAERIDAVAEFGEAGLARHRAGQTLAGYRTAIDPSAYPDFYVDYVDRTHTKPDSAAFAGYWQNLPDTLSEAAFSTLCYFAMDEIPAAVSDGLLADRAGYEAKFGELDVEVALMFLAFGRFDAAIADEDAVAFARAEAFAREALEAEFAASVVARYRQRWDAISGR